MGTPAYRVLADAFVGEGVDTIFVLTGDGNMYWEAAFSESPARHAIHVRHEHCACAMASAYARVTGTVGVASVTCGPGLTQTTTALATAAQAGIPLVVFAGESPMHAGWYNQAIDQAPLVTATGARYIAVHSLKRLQQSVTDAFHYARTRQQPVVIGVPFDLQQESLETVPAYVPSSQYLPEVEPRSPHPEALRKAVDRVRAARKIVILAGRGVRLAGAAQACIKLAEHCNAALATTLPARGLFAGNSRDVGVAGGFAHPVTAEVFGACDLVIAVGAGLNGYTTDGGRLFGSAQVLQIDDEPPSFVQGRKVADQMLAADARLGLEAILEGLRAEKTADWPDWGVADSARRLRTEPVDTREYAIPEGTIDPREVIRVLDGALPRTGTTSTAAGTARSFQSTCSTGRSRVSSPSASLGRLGTASPMPWAWPWLGLTGRPFSSRATAG